ncbi:MAG: hypothetical protein F4X47_15920 [Gammaproteobacteria bacterium]|nr:hypothetical protein [Gammaproteobacteria bacterium]MYC53793.1 hypothetical protein [Gammaproteobacteria bacterium]
MTEPGNGSGPEGTEGAAMEAAVSQRAGTAVKSFASIESAQWPAPTRAGPSEGLLAGLRHHLLAGETHYPDRPGMGELRRRVGEALPDVGFPAREPDGVLITQGEGESLFATILGLGGGEGAAIVARPESRHQRLLDWMRVRVIEPGTDAASEAEAAFHLIEHGAGAGTPGNGNTSETPGLVQVHAIGDRLFGGSGAEAAVPTDAIVIGSLHGLDGMQPFSLGFVAAPVAVRPRIAKWKQASSICSPAPSQRAALWALGVRP